MKRILTMVTAIILTTSLAAFAEGKHDWVSHKTSYEMQFTKLYVEDGIDVVLINSNEKAIAFEGCEANIARVDWKIKDGVLTVSSKKSSLKGKVKVMLNVSNLTEIHVKEGAEVSSIGQLKVSNLNIYLDGDAFVAVKNLGNIKIIKIEDTDMEVRKVVGDVRFS